MVHLRRITPYKNGHPLARSGKTAPVGPQQGGKPLQSEYTTAAPWGRGLTEQLRAIFEALPDEELLAALEATRWTGRPGYAIRVMWRSVVASFVLGIVHDTDLVRALQGNPVLASACGITDQSGVPTKFAYCRFRKKLLGFTELVQNVFTSIVTALKDSIPDLGQTVAVDTTDIKAWAHQSQSHRHVDIDAGWGVKDKTGRKHYWLGYKAHVVVDTATELLLWFKVTPGNTHDGKTMPALLTEAKQALPWLQPIHVLADKGYDSRESFRFVAEDLKALPIIDVQARRGMGAKARESRPCEAMPIPELFGGTIRYQCTRRPWDPKCPRFGEGCPYQPPVIGTKQHAVFALPYYEQYTPFPYGSTEWKLLYNQRVSVERAFSRAKTYRKLDGLRVRRMAKARLHVALSLLAMVAEATRNAAFGVSVRQSVAAA